MPYHSALRIKEFVSANSVLNDANRLAPIESKGASRGLKCAVFLLWRRKRT